MATFLTALASRIYGNGIDLGDVAKSFVAEGMKKTSDATVINDDGRKWTFGEMSGTYKSEGFLSVESEEDLADGAWDMIRRAYAAEQVIIAAPVGDTVGYPAVGLKPGGTKAAVMPSVGETVGYSLDGETLNGFEPGVVLVPISTKTGTFNGTSVDAGAASTGGAAAFLAWGEFDGTNVTVKIQHSTDNSTWADAATFTDIDAARGGERIEIAPGTLNRYRRAIISGGTFTSVELMVMLAAK
ncbi:MAG: hypothetical protein E6R04_10345 [Spirochaetes bacterium]|nr:MAG: hypothetical protein E6R04_10345 [Spirochaetota bacterium]